MKMRHLFSVGILLLASTSARAGIVCHSIEATDSTIKVVVELQPGDPGAIQKRISGVTKIIGESSTQKFRSTFLASSRFLRLGYMETLSTYLSSDLTLVLSGRSFTNEGPAAIEEGQLTYGVNTNDPMVVRLRCN